MSTRIHVHLHTYICTFMSLRMSRVYASRVYASRVYASLSVSAHIYQVMFLFIFVCWQEDHV